MEYQQPLQSHFPPLRLNNGPLQPSSTASCRLSPDIIAATLRDIMRSAKTPSPLPFISRSKKTYGGSVTTTTIFAEEVEENGKIDRLPSLWSLGVQSSEKLDEFRAPDYNEQNHPPVTVLEPSVTTLEHFPSQHSNSVAIPKRPLLIRPSKPASTAVCSDKPSTTQQSQHPTSLFSPSAAASSKATHKVVPSATSAFSSFGRLGTGIPEQPEASSPFGAPINVPPTIQGGSIPVILQSPTPLIGRSNTAGFSSFKPFLTTEATEHKTTTTTTLAFGVLPAPTSKPSNLFSEDKYQALASTLPASSATGSAIIPPSFKHNGFGAERVYHVGNIGRANTRGIKRKRTTNDQLQVLENAFADDPLPSKRTKERLAQETGLSLKRIQIWFQNRRAKQKKTGDTSPSLKRQHTSSPDEEM